MAPNTPVPPVYNSTFILHRLSPLHTPETRSLFTGETLQTHGRLLAKALKGNALGGFGSAIGDVDEVFARSGDLRDCRWSWLGRRISSSDDEVEESTMSADGLSIFAGIKIDIEFERAKYMALLLRDASETGEFNEKFTRLPLVLTRMPALVRTTLLEYLAVNFDTRAEPLLLSGSLICESLESFLAECAEDPDNFEKTVKEVQLSISFLSPAAPNLKTLDVAIRREDVRGFVRHGQTNASSTASQARVTNGTFMAALQKYLQAHLALDIDHQQVLISRVACGAFALGREGKVKLFPPGSSLDEEGNFDDASAASKDATAKILQILLGAATGNV